MTLFEIVAQVFGIFGMILNVFSYQQKTQRGVIGFQLLGSVFFSINFFMLGAMVGSILNVLGILRAIVYMEKKRFRSDRLWWVFAFTALYLTTYVLTFTVLGKEPTFGNLLIESLPVIGMILTTISFRFTEAKTIRRFGIFNSPMWLTYNIANFSVGAICCEVMNLISIVVGMLRFDIKKKSKKA